MEIITDLSLFTASRNGQGDQKKKARVGEYIGLILQLWHFSYEKEKESGAV